MELTALSTQALATKPIAANKGRSRDLVMKQTHGVRSALHSGITDAIAELLHKNLNAKFLERTDAHAVRPSIMKMTFRNTTPVVFGAALLVCVVIAPTSHGSWLGDQTGVHINLNNTANKVGTWVGHQTLGSTPSNVNASANEVKETAATAKEILQQVKPGAQAVVSSAKNSLDQLDRLLALIKWPLFAATVLLALWLSGRVVMVWKPLLKLNSTD